MRSDSQQLKGWLKQVREGGDPSLVGYRFPSDDLYREYLATIRERPARDVIVLARHFLPEEINWVVALLPHKARFALQAIRAYDSAFLESHPDGMIHRLYDSLALIRAKFIGFPQSRSDIVRLLSESSSRDFECIIAELYHQMGYHVRLTSKVNDAGKDVIASRNTAGRKEMLLIECKKWSDLNPVGRPVLQKLVGALSERTTKGVLVTTSRFTRSAIAYARTHRIELIPGMQLGPLLNRYVGYDWAVRLETLVALHEGEYRARISAGNQSSSTLGSTANKPMPRSRPTSP